MSKSALRHLTIKCNTPFESYSHVHRKKLLYNWVNCIGRSVIGGAGGATLRRRSHFEEEELSSA